MLALALDLVRARRIDAGTVESGLDPLPVAIRDDAGSVQGLGREQLDPQPQLELAPFAEDVGRA